MNDLLTGSDQATLFNNLDNSTILALEDDGANFYYFISDKGNYGSYPIIELIEIEEGLTREMSYSELSQLNSKGRIRLWNGFEICKALDTATKVK